MLARHNNRRRSVWIRVKPHNTPWHVPQSSDLLSTVFVPVLTLYVSFDLLTLMVSLKISSSISSAILKPLILPERERGREREEARSQCDVYLTFSTGPWLSGAVIASRTHRASRGSPSIGYRAPLTGCCIPASSLTQEPVMTKYSTRIRGGVWTHSWCLFPASALCICFECIHVHLCFYCPGECTVNSV